MIPETEMIRLSGLASSVMVGSGQPSTSLLIAARKVVDGCARKLACSSRWKSGPGKGQRPPGSECCVRSVGDGGHEAYTAIVWGGLLSRETVNITEAETIHPVEGNMCGTAMRGAGARSWSKTSSRTKGTRRNPPLRGGRLWEISCLTAWTSVCAARVGKARSRSRRCTGTRSQPCRSSDEACEQRRATVRGVGGAKDRGRGERGPATHAPGAEQGKRDPGAGPCRERRKAAEEGTVHCTAPPRQCRYAADGIPRAEARCRPWCEWRDVDGPRGRPRAEARGPARPGPPGSIPAAAVPPDVYTEGRWPPAAAGDCCPGGQGLSPDLIRGLSKARPPWC